MNTASNAVNEKVNELVNQNKELYESIHGEGSYPSGLTESTPESTLPRCKATVKARIEWPIVRDENGKVYSFLGSGARYGFDSTYAVAEQGVVKRRILEAKSLPWPYADNEVEIYI